MHYCARCGRVKETCLHCLQETGDKETSVYLSICLPVDLSTRLPVYPCTCRPIYGSLLLKRLSSRQGESERALLCKIWQGKGDMSALSTGNRGFKEASVYLSTCLLVYLSTCLHVYLSTCLPVYGSLLLKHLSSRQGESERALLCKIWQGKGSIRKPGIYGDTCLPVYLSTCRPVYPSICLPVDRSTRLHIYLSTVSYF